MTAMIQWTSFIFCLFASLTKKYTEYVKKKKKLIIIKLKNIQRKIY